MAEQANGADCFYLKSRVLKKQQQETTKKTLKQNAFQILKCSK